MKKVILLLVAFAVLSSCSKKEEQTPQFKEDGGKIQYPKGYMKEKIDNVDNPKVEKVNILVDLSNEGNNKSVNEAIGRIGFDVCLVPHNLAATPNWGSWIMTPDPDWQDLNEGAGGRYIYFYYSKTQYQYALCNFWVTTMENNYELDYVCTMPDGYRADLNDGAGGLFVWAHASFISPVPYNHRMIGFGTIKGNSSAIKAPIGWEKIPVDLNRGAGGPYIYFIVKWITY